MQDDEAEAPPLQQRNPSLRNLDYWFNVWVEYLVCCVADPTHFATVRRWTHKASIVRNHHPQMVQRDATRAQYYDNAMQAVEGLTAGRAIEQAYSFAWNAALPGFLRALQVCRTAYIVVIISTTTTTTIDLPHAAAATPPRGRPPHRRHPSSRRLRSLPACAPQGSRDAGAGRPGGGSWLAAWHVGGHAPPGGFGSVQRRRWGAGSTCGGVGPRVGGGASVGRRGSARPAVDGMLGYM